MAVLVSLAIAIALPVSIQQRFEKLSRIRPLHGSNFFRRAACNHATAMGAAFGTQIDDQVGVLDHIKIVFDHDDRITEAHEALQHVKQLLHVSKM